jgi:hypothetical protein
MSRARAVSVGNARGTLCQRRDDVYETPAAATEALIACEPLPHHLWEPCCGSGAIVSVLRAHGHEVTTSDLRTDRIDFLMEWRPPNGVEAIVTNPPHKLANQFVRHGLSLVPLVIILLRLNFLRAAGRADLIDYRLAHVRLFRERLPRMHRQGWQGPRLKDESSAHAWFIFQREPCSGPICLDPISCRTQMRRQ